MKPPSGETGQAKFGHYCPEWDFMWIDDSYPEFECCICYRLPASPEKGSESK